ncbi:MAG TPA: c-type cytochrome [Candidatus Deferrimicrobiaceae bacterium]
MTKRTAFWIFLIGTLSSSVLFLYLTVDTHRQVEALSHADRLDERVVAGKRTFQKYNCNDCHTILGFGGYYAPDLTRVVRRVGEEGIRFRVSDPAGAFANSFRKMPRQRVTAAEIDGLVAFFTWVGGIENGDWPPQDSPKRLSRGSERLVAAAGLSPGAAVFQTKGCMNCHSLHGAGGTFGPAMDTVGRRRSLESIEHYIKDPKSQNPAAKMPAQTGLTDGEREEVARFLSGLK